MGGIDFELGTILCKALMIITVNHFSHSKFSLFRSMLIPLSWLLQVVVSWKWSILLVSPLTLLGLSLITTDVRRMTEKWESQIKWKQCFRWSSTTVTLNFAWNARSVLPIVKLPDWTSVYLIDWRTGHIWLNVQSDDARLDILSYGMLS